MVENRAGGPEGADETSGAGGTQADQGAAGATGATGTGRRGGRRGAAGAAGAGGEGGKTRKKRGAAAGGGEAGGEGGTTGTRKRGGRAAGGTGSATGTAGGRGGARGRRAAAEQGPDLRQDLRDFATAHQQGWSHHDWLNLVNALEQRGHDVGDRDRIGRELERERLVMRLEQVQGMGERRVQALADRFGTLWSLRQASVDEIAEVQNINRQLAEKIHEQLR